MASFKKIIPRKNPSTLILKEDILKSEYIQNKIQGIDLLKTNIETEYAYLAVCISDFKKQAKCNDKKCFSKIMGYWNDFEIIENQILKTIRPCHCLQSKKGNWTSIDNISLTCFEQKFQNTSFKDFKTPSKTLTAVKSYLEKLVDNFPNYTKPLIIIGPSQSGKTFISSIIANELFEKNNNIALVDMKNSLVEFNPENQLQFDVTKKRYIKSATLFIENLGKEKNTGFSRDFFLYQIIKERVRLNRPTFITSEYSILDLEKKYSKNNKTEEGRMFINLIKDNLLPIILSPYNK